MFPNIRGQDTCPAHMIIWKKYSKVHSKIKMRKCKNKADTYIVPLTMVIGMHTHKKLQYIFN